MEGEGGGEDEDEEGRRLGEAGGEVEGGGVVHAETVESSRGLGLCTLLLLLLVVVVRPQVAGRRIWAAL